MPMRTTSAPRPAPHGPALRAPAQAFRAPLRTAGALALALFALARPAAGQTPPDGQIVERVLAIVGDSMVLQSQVEEEIQRMRLGGIPTPPPEDPGYDAFFHDVLQSAVNRVLVLQAAARDTLIRADEVRIEQQVQARIDELIQNFGGRDPLARALQAEGLTMAEYRDVLTTSARQEQIQQMFLQSRLREARPVEVSEAEMRARFESASAQLQQRPRLVTFRQVVVAPQATEEAWEAARAEADSLLQRIRAGEEFEVLARAYSDDPGSAQLGGDLGWFRRGRMVQEFEDVAFGLSQGSVSQVVRTDFGFHIIRVDRVRPGERQGRHILVMPEKTEEDVARARALAEEVAAAARAGASMDSLYRAHSDPAAPDSLTMPVDQIGQLPPPYAVVRNASDGQILGPLEYRTADETRFAIVRVEEIREAGAYTFEDVRPQLASQLQQEKQIERIIADLRERTYIEIRG